ARNVTNLDGRMDAGRMADGFPLNAPAGASSLPVAASGKKDTRVADIELKNISKSFGRTQVIADVSLHVRSGEFVVFLGPSGCGKSTLLRMIAGLESVDEGEIWIGGRRVDGLPPGERRVAMVFQHYALYPHMTVRENMAFGLRNVGVAGDEIERRIADV